MEFESPANSPERSESLTETVGARVQAIVDAAEREAAAVQRDLETRRRQAADEAQRYLDEARQRASRIVIERTDSIRSVTHRLLAEAQQARSHLDELVAKLAAITDEVEQLDADARSEEPPPDDPGQDGAHAGSEQAVGIARWDPSGEGVGAGPGGDLDSQDATITDAQPAGLGTASVPPPPVRETESSTVGAWRIPEAGETNIDAARLTAIQMAVAGGTRDEVGAHLTERFEVSDVGTILDDVFGEDSQGSSRMSWGPA